MKHKILTLAILSVLSTSAMADSSPFSLPLHLANNITNGVRKTVVDDKTQEFKQTTETGSNISYKGAMKPNIMLYLDDSNSMNSQIAFSDPRIIDVGNAWYAVRNGNQTDSNGCLKFGLKGRNYCYDTSWSLLKRSIYEMLDENYQDQHGNVASYGSRANWGIFYMNTYAGIYGNSYNDNFKPGIDNVNRLKKSLESAGTANTTPFGGGLAHAVSELYDSIDYRCQKNYVIAFTDGDANVNYNKYPMQRAPWTEITPKRCGLSSIAFATGWGGDQFKYSQLSCINGQDLKPSGYDKAGVSYNDPEFEKQTIEIFTIGYNVSNKSRNALSETSSKNILDKDGKVMQTAYFPTTGDGMREAFRNIFSIIASQNSSSFGSPKIEVTPGNVISNPSVETGNSSSNVYLNEEVYTLSAPGMIANDSTDEIVSEAATILVDANMRSAQIFFDKRKPDGSLDETVTDRPTAQFGSGSVWIKDNNTLQRRIDYVKDNSYFNIQKPYDIQEYKDGLLAWLSRNHVPNRYDMTKYRNDRGQMGDVLESDVISIGKRVNGKKELVVTAANDGMVYVFKRSDTNTDLKPYNFAYNYVPVSLTRSNEHDLLAQHYHKIAKEDYAKDAGNPHIFMLSGGIVAQQLEKLDDKNQAYLAETYMIGNAGRGARGTYGLYLSDKNGNTYNNPTPMFNEIDVNTLSNLGYTQSYPITGYAGNNVSQKRQKGLIGKCYPGKPADCDVGDSVKMVTFLASGIASHGKDNLKSQATELYLIDSFNNGKLLNTVKIPEGSGLMTPTLLDIDFDGVYDYAFAGDYSGNMYRFDIRDYNNISYKKIFESDGWNRGYPKRPISSAPAISRLDGKRYVIIWGTGSDVFEEDLNTYNTQAMYGVYQEFDENLDIKKEFNETLTADNLLKQEFVNSYDDKETKYRVASSNAIEGKDGLLNKGWKIELTGAGEGERIVVKPEVVQRTVYAVTRIYTKQNSGNTSTPSVNIPSDIQNNATLLNAWFADNGWKKVKSPATPPGAQSCNWDTIPETIVSDTTTGDVVNTGDPCLSGNKANTQRVKKEKICNVKWTEETVWEMENTGTTQYSTRSSIIQLRSDTGGAIPIPPQRGMSYIKWDIPGLDGYYGSSQTVNGLQSLVFTGLHNTGYNEDQMGAGGGTGTVAPFGGIRDTSSSSVYSQQNPCAGGLAYKSHINRTNTKVDGETSAIEVNLSFVPVNCLRRISWREIL